MRGLLLFTAGLLTEAGVRYRPLDQSLFGEWSVEWSGAVILERGTGAVSVRVLRAVEGPSTLVVRLENAGGDPLENVPVVVHWPDAPLLPPEQQACGRDRGLVIPSKDNGNAEFGMGPGLYRNSLRNASRVASSNGFWPACNASIQASRCCWV